MNLLEEGIPFLCKSKRAVLLFFKGAGAKDIYLDDLFQIVETNKDSITKREITR